MADTNIYEDEENDLPESKFNVPFGSFLPSLGTGLLNWGLNQVSAHSQRQWQEKMMNKANAYNSPLAQAIRMRAAGLNPYQDMDAVPSASAGTGAQGAPANIQDPLASALTLAQIRNMDAQTGKTETETDKILQEIANLELLYQKGFIEKDEMQFRLEQLKKAWKDKSQYTADLEFTESETAKTTAEGKVADEQAKKIESDRLFTEALTATENALRDLKANLIKAQTAAENAAANASIAQASKLMLEGKTIELQNQREVLRNSAMQFYGFDPTTLPPELSATLMNNFAAVVESQWNKSVAKEAMDKCHALLSTYRDKSIWTPTSDTYDWSNKFKLGPFEISKSSGVGKSN